MLDNVTWNDSLKPDQFVCGKCGIGLDIANLDNTDSYLPKFCPECGACVMFQKDSTASGINVNSKFYGGKA